MKLLRSGKIPNSPHFIIRRKSSGLSQLGLWATQVTFSAFLLSSEAPAKLFSAAYQQERARRIIEDIYRETRLDADISFWGEQYKQEIARYTQIFKTGNYSIFADLQIESAIARCAVNAKNESNYEEWIRRMDLFDRAAEELDPRDRSRYYFAKGLTLLQTIPNRLRELPADFYKAAENGLPSVQWADIVPKSGSQGTPMGGEQVRAIYERFAESYAKNSDYQESFKMYLLALKNSRSDPELIVKMAMSAERGGSPFLAYQCGLLFVALCDIHDGVRVKHDAILDSIHIDPRTSAYDTWHACETGLLEQAIRVSAPSSSRPFQPLRDRQLTKLDSRFIQPLSRTAGPYENLLKITLCTTHWADSALVAWFVPQIGGSIDAHNGAIRALADRLRQDPRFAQHKEIAVWEYRRWREADKLDTLAQLYPERYHLATGDGR